MVLRRASIPAAALAIAAIVVSALSTTARAANWPDPRLEAAAASVTGHAVTVNCENDPAAWQAGAQPKAGGYALPALNTMWLGPVYCLPLHSLLDHPATSGFGIADLYSYSEAIQALVHEAVHLRGGVYADCGQPPDHTRDFTCEGRTDCLALTLDESVATDFFGIPRTVDQTTVVPKTKIVYRVVRRKVRGHWKRVRVRRKITEYVDAVIQVRNPVLDKMHAIQVQEHDALGAKEPWYKGDC